MFIGKFQHTFDDKGRIFMPAKFRDELAEGMVATIGIDKCIFIYTKEEFSRFREKLDGVSITNKEARKFSRFFYGFACECECDKQGRIMLTQELRNYAGIEKEAVVVGGSTKIEIWNADKWNEDNNLDDFDMDDLAQNMAQFGL
ncbi:MAG: division/cell wall cluster transcriptional repressor MraZ [Ruminococcaceae bacterium]|nr:division/cell wall cluster transcriptional repressor MraZ [Oscillospiraceae bacterium]